MNRRLTAFLFVTLSFLGLLVVCAEAFVADDECLGLDTWNFGIGVSPWLRPGKAAVERIVSWPHPVEGTEHFEFRSTRVGWLVWYRRTPER